MNQRKFAAGSRLLAVAAALLFPATSLVRTAAQAAPPVIAKPKVGQPGKDAPWVPTSNAVVQQMLEMADVDKDDYLVDLGSGDGRLVIGAAKRGAHAMGVEYNSKLVELSRVNSLEQGVGDRTLFVQGDVFETDFSRATVVSLFMLPDVMFKLRTSILKMAPGTRVVSNSFKMANWYPDETRRVADECPGFCEAYMWIVPAKIGGEWESPDGRIVIEQHFQKFSGRLIKDGHSSWMSEPHLRGDQISFVAGGKTYTGTVRADHIEGRTQGAAGDRPWTAKYLHP